MPGVIEILKKRFPEALLIVVLQASMIFLGGQMRAMINEKLEVVTSVSNLAVFSMTLCMGFLMVIWIMMELGFLSTMYKEGATQQPPARLIIEGKYFFWRNLRFQLIVSIAVIMVAQLVLVIGNVFYFRSEDAANIPELFEHFCMMAANFILVRQLLLTQAIMVIEDCNVIPAVMISLRFRLSRIKVLAIALILTSAFATIAPMAFMKEGTLGFEVNAISIIYSFTVSAFMFIITVAAFRFVAMAKKIQMQSDTEITGDSDRHADLFNKE